MRSTREIKKALRSRVNRELKRVYMKGLAKRPLNCVYNKSIELAGTDHVKLGVCVKFTRWQDGQDDGLWICDTVEDAKNCDMFVCRYNKEYLRETFDHEVLRNPERLAHYRDLDVLFWILEEEPKIRRWYEYFWAQLKEVGSNMRSLVFRKSGLPPLVQMEDIETARVATAVPDFKKEGQ